MKAVNADSLIPAVVMLSADAASAADALEMAAADLGEAIATLVAMPVNPEIIARLRRRRLWLVREVNGLREAARVSDDAVSARMAKALIADFERAERVHKMTPPSLQVVK